MNIEEAIENNKRLKEYHKETTFEDDAKSLQLGIEALERLKELTELANERQIVDWRHEVRKPLPGEEAK